MTYCVALRLDSGLVFLSDSRTNAGVDHVATARKMSVFENPGERLMVFMTAGNLSISQSIKQVIGEYVNAAGKTIWTVATMYEAAQIVGEAVRVVYDREALKLEKFGIDFNVGIIFGGQIKGEGCRLFQVYAAGNFIESLNENTYFQIGEAKYGKPILDRVITPASTLDQAAKCALISMDSTMRSNISVGLPLDLLLYGSDTLAVTRFVTIDEKNQYFQMIHENWGKQLTAVFNGLADPVWNANPDIVPNVVLAKGSLNEPLVLAPPAANLNPAQPVPLQTLAQGPEGNEQP
ncbi:putative proteasome-type protease [Collimonas sp. PA-H2]|uniref:peptidase n=1 Tax=Collimonas sp. PA-H2 TaxID=1881062 RepID=UPI000BF37DA0|nr:peptidase [Collimonas sp. PA-H2]PFH09056.1 putative proteasome-type protease [Collimonas sp. PA-H2]